MAKKKQVAAEPDSNEALIKSIWALKGAVDKLTEELAKPRPPIMVYVYPQNPDYQIWYGSWPPPAPPSPSSGEPISGQG